MEKYMVNIIQIDWLDKENPEAEILFEVNGKQFWAFCHPCNFEDGEVVDVCFNFIEEDISEFTFWNENKIQKKEMIKSENNKCKYYCYGQVKSISPVYIDCGILTLSLGNWTNDEKIIGSYVYFVISRLDIEKVLE